VVNLVLPVTYRGAYKKRIMKLLDHHYGKVKVRVMKVSRAGAQHSLKELAVSVMLKGEFDASYTRGDNHLVVPTDTMKNTVYILAKEKLGAENETFGLALGEHFLNTYPQISQVEIGLSECAWDRMSPGSRPHPHSFLQNSPAKPFTKVNYSRNNHSIESGIEDLLLLKTTGSGFEGYVKDKYTTLPETKDRIMATKLKATWSYEKSPSSYAATSARILDAMLAVFANNYSPSVQVTLFQMGEAALKTAAEISRIYLAMPNKHCLLVNLSPFGLENHNEIFVPTDEPHGQIEGTVSRG
jgi:urate oxidase